MSLPECGFDVPVTVIRNEYSSALMKVADYFGGRWEVGDAAHDGRVPEIVSQ